MNRIHGVVFAVVGFVFALGVAMPTWAGPPPNPTASDVNGNTAGGTDALKINTGSNNTAFGLDTLLNNMSGVATPRIGSPARRWSVLDPYPALLRVEATRKTVLGRGRREAASM